MQIIDFVNYSLWTNKWKASHEIDIVHWRKFEAFKRLTKEKYNIKLNFYRK